MFGNQIPDEQSPLLQNEAVSAEQRAVFPQSFRERAMFVIARNLIPVVGILFLGWSPANMVVLYFVDTLGGMWALVAALMMQFDPNLSALPWLSRMLRLLGYFALSLFLIAFIAIPLGVPLVFVLAPINWSWQAALADQSFLLGLLTIVVLSVISMIRYAVFQRRELMNQRWSQREFGLLFMRWVVMLFLIYSGIVLLGEYGVILLVIGYAVTSTIGELYPDRFLGMFDRSFQAEPTTELKLPPHRRKRGRRKNKPTR
jgi:Family of unknown function (DUF6498)